jgi:hypothetical protein
MGISRPTKRQAELFAVEMQVALVFGMDGDGGVAEHGFGARGGDGQKTRRNRFAVVVKDG